MRILLLAALAIFAVAVYTAFVASVVQRDVVHFVSEHDKPAEMTYVRFTKDGLTTIVAMPEGGDDAARDLAAALSALDSGQNKEESWQIASGAEIHLVVPPKHGETPQGTEHCERFARVKNILQGTPGLEPVTPGE